MPDITVHDGKIVTITVAPLDAGNGPGVETAAPTYSVDNTSVATVGNVSADGLHADITGVAPGTFNVSVNGVNASGTFFTVFTGSCIGGPATHFSIAVGPEH